MTSSLVAWVLGLVELRPLDYGLDGQMFVHDGRMSELPVLNWPRGWCSSPGACGRRTTVSRNPFDTPNNTFWDLLFVSFLLFVVVPVLFIDWLFIANVIMQGYYNITGS